MKKKTLLATLATVATLTAGASTPLWLRDVKISPDGSRIAFTYKGDIYTVPTSGGKAQRLTTVPSYEAEPVWSPDSKLIAFASDRAGSMDIYVMPAEGGQATRLTSNSARETPESFTPDGKAVLFSASIQDAPTSSMFPSGRLTELYSVPTDGRGAVTQILSTPARMVTFIPNANGNFLYQDVKGMEDEWRKHHTSSVTRDVWLYDAKTGAHTNLTNHSGEDLYPTVSKDGKTAYILSERDGLTMNLYSFPIGQANKIRKLTDFKTHPVRFLSMADNGTLAMGWNGEIYTMTADGQPTKVDIDLTVDDHEEPLTLNVNRNFDDAAVSPDGKQMAVVKRGELFVTSVEYPSTKRITNTAATEGEVTWAPDNRTLYYTSERDGRYGIYKATAAREDDPNVSNATLINEEAVFPGDTIERTRPRLSPDGKQLAYIEDRNKLMVKNLKTGRVRQLTDGSLYPRRDGGFPYSWSPDGRWIVAEMVGNNRDPYTDIFLIDAVTGKTTDLTESGYFDEQPRWVMDGNAILFLSERYGMRNHASWGSMSDAMIIFLNREAYDKFRLSKEDYALLKEAEKANSKKEEPAATDKGKKSNKNKKADKELSPENDPDAALPGKTVVKVELDGIEDRIVRLTPNSSDIASAIIDKDGKNLYYLSAIEQGYDLWKLGLRDGDAEIVSKLDAGHLMMEQDKDGKIYLLGSNVLKRLDPSSDKLTSITPTGTFDIDQAKERVAMFDNIVMQEREMFYTPTMHGVDWPAMTEAYRRFLPHINNNYDYAEMLSEMLGELNVSHTGARYFPDGAMRPTASLGLLYDLTYNGKGLKVAEVVAGGPMDHASIDITPGCIIESINGTAIDHTTDYTSLFNGIAGKKTLVAYRDAKGASHESVIIPFSNSRMNDLLYNRWVKQREADVDSLSGGRLGYVHLRQMNDDSFRDIYSKILGKYNNKEGIVIDTRWNGGGRLHEDIEVLFSGDKYFTQMVRGVKAADMPSRRWNKPSIMIQCEANYSNAHGTPWVYKHKGLGKLVGAPVPGTMTSVNWITMQDPSLVYGIPVVGYELPDGTYLENAQLEPDIYILNDPAKVVKGIDDQLRVAVETLLHDIDNGKTGATAK